MKTTTFAQSNYVDYYSALQLSLPLDLGIKIDSNNEVVSFLKALEGVNLNKYLKRKESRGRRGYDKVMLLKVVLFSYFLNERDVRKIAELCRNDIRYMYLSQEETPSFMAFERLLTDYLIYNIDDIFFEVSLNIGNKMNINTDIQYIDGTKIEANANRNTFVYKKRITNARDKLFVKISESLDSLNDYFNYCHKRSTFYCALEMGYTAQYLMELMVVNNIDPVYGKGKRKHKIQGYYDMFLEYFIKLDEYEYWLFVIGNERNSCSKTDHDATMCATKIDYYCNTGLSRPCYNAQIAVSDGIIVNADLYQRPADVKTFIPFVERYHEHAGKYPTYPMADAGYGSYDNYMYCIEHGIELYLKYGMYAKKNSRDFRKQIYNTLNWEKDDNGYKICPGGEVFNKYLKDQYDDRNEYLRIIQSYTNEKGCAECPHKDKCCKGERRVISRDVVIDEFYSTVDQNLSTDFGKELKKQRSIQVEGAFGVIKQDMKFTRFIRRGLKNTKMEFLLVCLGYNFRKYHLYRLKQEKKLQENTLVS